MLRGRDRHVCAAAARQRIDKGLTPLKAALTDAAAITTRRPRHDQHASHAELAY